MRSGSKQAVLTIFRLGLLIERHTRYDSAGSIGTTGRILVDSAQAL
jgi:hypothetical protein